MPNWVFNGLTVEGNPDLVKQMRDQLNKPFKLTHKNSWNMNTQEFETKQVLYSNPVIAFYNIFPPTDLDAYTEQPKRSELPVSDPNWWADTNKVAATDNSWYSFNNREWGTKWDVAVSNDDTYPDTNMEEAENGENYVVHYNFQTAWAPPVAAMEKLSAQYPTLLLTLSYEEETGWGGEMELLRGVIISQSEYGWMCRECEHTENETPYCEECEYDMCPNCGYGEPDEKCQTHAVQSEPTEKAEV